MHRVSFNSFIDTQHGGGGVAPLPTSPFGPVDDDDMPPLVDPPTSSLSPHPQQRQQQQQPNSTMFKPCSIPPDISADGDDNNNDDDDDDMPPLVEPPPFSSSLMVTDRDDNDDDDDMPPLVDPPQPASVDDDRRWTSGSLNGGGMMYTFQANMAPTPTKSNHTNALVLSHSSPIPIASPPPESPNAYTSSPTPSPIVSGSFSSPFFDSPNSNVSIQQQHQQPPMTYNFSFSSHQDMESFVPYEPRLGTDATSGALTLLPSAAAALPANPNNPPSTTTTSSHSKKRPASYIPRPPNAFILFRASFVRGQRIPDRVEGNHSTLSKIAGMVWKGMRKEDREVWEKKAEAAQEEHRRKYPDWRFRLAGRGCGPGGGGGSWFTSGGGGLGKVKDGTSTSSGGSVHDDTIPLILSPSSEANPSPSSSRKRRNSARETSQDEQRSRQKRCEKIAVLLEQGKSGLELQKEVEKYDEIQAREREMERERGKERARREEEVMKTEEGLGRKQGKESLEDKTTKIQTSSTPVPKHSRAQSQGQNQSRKVPVGRKRAETITTNGVPTITSISTTVDGSAVIKRETSFSANDVGTSKSPEHAKRQVSRRTNSNVTTSPHLHPPPTPVPASPPTPSPPADVRFAVPLNSIARRSSSAPAAPGRIPGDGHSTTEQELGPIKSPFSAYLGDEGRVQANVTVVNGRMDTVKGGVKGGMRPQPVSDSNNFGTNAIGDCVLSVQGGSPSRGDCDTQECRDAGFSYTDTPNPDVLISQYEDGMFPTLTSGYNHERVVAHTPPEVLQQQSTVNVSSYSTLVGWAGTENAISPNSAIDHETGVNSSSRADVGISIAHNVGPQSTALGAYTVNTTSTQDFHPAPVHGLTTSLTSAIPMASYVPMPLAPQAQSASAALHTQHHYPNSYSDQLVFTGHGHSFPQFVPYATHSEHPVVHARDKRSAYSVERTSHTQTSNEQPSGQGEPVFPYAR